MQDKAYNNLFALRTPVTTPEPEECDLPNLGSGEYQAHGLAANKPLFAIHLHTAKGELRSFQYVHLDSDCRYTPGCIALRFIGLKPMEVVIRGRNLWRLYDCIHRHVMPWVVEIDAARDFVPDGHPVINRIEFIQVAEEAV